MNERKFKVGDKVEFITWCSDRCLKGDKGVVINATNYDVKVQLDKNDYRSGNLGYVYLKLQKDNFTELNYEIY